MVAALLHQEAVRRVAAGGRRHVAHLHVVVVGRRALRPELPAVVEAADKQDDAEEGGDGRADGDVKDLHAPALRTWGTGGTSKR